MTEPTDWVKTMKSPRPVSLAAWWRCARRGDIWWPGKTFTIDLSNEEAVEGCCGLADDHDGPCEWYCDDCGGTGR